MLEVSALSKLRGGFGVNLRSGRTRQEFAEPAGVEAFNQPRLCKQPNFPGFTPIAPITARPFTSDGLKTVSCASSGAAIALDRSFRPIRAHTPNSPSAPNQPPR